MKTSKIKEVKRVSEPYGKFNTLYHHLVMENGDKIDIGKVKKQEVGNELTYEIIGDIGQHPFTKAKSVNPNWNNNSNNFNKDSKTQSKIDYFAAYQRACLYFIMKGHKATDEELDNQINSIISKASGQTEVIKKSAAEVLDNIQEDIDDLPF